MEPVKMLLTAVSDAPCDIKTWSWKERIWRQLGGQRKATHTIPVTQAERSWLGEQMFIQHLTLPLSTISLSLTHTCMHYYTRAGASRQSFAYPGIAGRVPSEAGEEEAMLSCKSKQVDAEKKPSANICRWPLFMQSYLF